MSNTIFLLYHDIDSADEPCIYTDSARLNTVIDVNEFRAHMEYLKQRGYRVLSYAQYTELQHETRMIEMCMVLTFDDGHISNYTKAYPILLELGFTASFYIITDKIGSPDYLSEDHILEMNQNGMEIGSHTHTHRYLSTLPDEEKKLELQRSRQILQQITGQEIHSLAYPGGHFDRRTIACCKEAGFLSAMSCKVGKNAARENHYILKRIEMRRNTPLNDFVNGLSSKNILFYQAVEALKTIIRKTFGLSLYRKVRSYLYFLYPFKR
jgi:peptidoglycan/xylan/chitin deacetylase (PgdA/CDA1 family)